MSVYFVGGAADDYQTPLVLFQNLISSDNLTSSAAASGTNALNVLSDDTFSGWSPGGAGSGFLQAIFTTALAGVCVAVGAHNLGTVRAFVRVQTWSGSGWEEVRRFVQGDNDPFMVLIPLATQVLGVRVYITFTVQGVVPFIGMLRAAPVLRFPTDIAAGYTPANYAKTVEVYQSRSMGGQFFAPRLKRMGGTMGPSLNPVPRSFADADLAPFCAHYDSGRPFFWAGNPVRMPDDVALARRADGAGELRPTYRAGGSWADLSLEFDIHGA